MTQRVSTAVMLVQQMPRGKTPQEIQHLGWVLRVFLAAPPALQHIDRHSELPRLMLGLGLGAGLGLMVMKTDKVRPRLQD